jgi:hypothetical protein
MIRRFPVKGTPDDVSTWASPARNLGMQLVRLGLWATVKDDLAKRLEQRWKSEQLVETFALALPDHGLAKGVRDIVELLFLHPHWRRWDLERLAEADVYPELATFPLPSSVAAKYEGRRALPTMLTLMSEWFSNPRATKEAELLERSLLLFGAACVVVGPLQRESPAYRPWWIDMNAHMRQAFAMRLGREVWNWIAAQLPDRAFHHELEAMLRSIPSLWSRVVTAKGADPVTAEGIDESTSKMIEALREDLGEVISDLEEESEPEGHALA